MAKFVSNHTKRHGDETLTRICLFVSEAADCATICNQIWLGADSADRMLSVQSV